MAMSVICTTTINPRTPAIRMYDQMEGWHLIVTGDMKSPVNYKLQNGSYISWEQQQAEYPELCKLIGPNSTMRGRMIALLEAHKRSPELVAMVDDDCLPYPGWPGSIYVGCKYRSTFIPASLGFDVGMLAYGTPARGFPPQLWGKSMEMHRTADIIPMLQSNPCDGQADVDAVWRLGGKVDYGYSAIREPVWSNGFSLINPMHTIVLGSVLRDYCGEIPFVGHVCDIWAGYLFQAAHPNSTIYGPSNCYHAQDRLYEKVLRELESEIYSYRWGLEFLRGLQEHGPNELEQIKCLPPKAVEAITLYRSYYQ